MTSQEAVELVLQDAVHGISRPQERGQIFVLDMGEEVRIINFARQMIHLAGLEPERNIQIRIVGPRSGEKLYEELFEDAETWLPVVVSGIFLARSHLFRRTTLDALEMAAHSGDEMPIRRIVAEVIPGYAAPSSAVAA